MDRLHSFLELFIPLFVAIDAFGLLPIFVAVTDGMPLAQRRRITYQSVFTALVISLAFMFLGDAVFRFLRIDEADFKIAGGIILLVLAVLDLLISGKPSVHETEMVGIVPLAMPLIAGPATLTTILVLVSRRGYAAVSLGLAVNFALLLLVLLASGAIARVVGMSTLRAFSKLVMVLLAAIAVNFIRVGIVQAMATPH